MEDNKIIDGKAISKKILSELKEKLAQRKIKPGLVLILVGNNPSSEIYVKMKGRACEELGYYSVTDKFPDNMSEIELLDKIQKYNSDEKIHGILVQLPLPEHINELKILESVNYKKDVDGFNPVNSGRLVIGEKCFVPCTPAGIIELLLRSGVKIKGKNAVIIGRSNIVGKPVSILLMQKNKNTNATVTVCHSATKNISEHTKKADIIVAAMGKANFLKPEMIQEGCVIIDVGINRIEDKSAKNGYRIVGDVDYAGCYPKVSKITPVPGGVGPMTIAMLMYNTYLSSAGEIYS